VSYETVTLSSVVSAVLRRLGKVPADADETFRLVLVEAIAGRLEQAWQYYRWPVLLAIEQRRYRDAWTATAYAAGAEVWHAATAAYYKANAITAGADVPGASTKWDALESFYRYVAYEQTGQTAIRVCLRAWETDPREDPEAQEIEFAVAPEGIWFAADACDEPWLEYQGRCPNLHAEAYSSAVAYGVGACVYYSGEVYQVIVTTTAGDTPVSAPTKFSLSTIPRFMAAALKAGALADTRLGDNQDDKAAAREPKFEDLLEEEVFQFSKLQGQTGRR
jgi:hypothetical protein